MSGPVDDAGYTVTPERILDSYLNTGDYDDYLDGYVTWLDGHLNFSDSDGTVYSWRLELLDSTTV